MPPLYLASHNAYLYVKVTSRHNPYLTIIMGVYSCITSTYGYAQAYSTHGRDNNLRHIMDVANTKYGANYDLHGKCFFLKKIHKK